MLTSGTVNAEPNAPISIADCLRAKENRPIRVLLLANDMVHDHGIGPLLTAANCRIVRASSADRVSALIGDQAFDAIVVDFRPDLLGYQAVRQLRLGQVSLPLLFVSARSSSEAFEQARAVGADDVIVLPSDPKGLKSRLEMLVRKTKNSHRDHVLQFGPLQLDIVANCVRVSGKTLALTNDEYAALELMVSRNGAPVGKTALLEQISCETTSAEALVSRLRRKLAKVGVTDLIRTVWGIGYALAEGRTTIAGSTRLSICYAA